MTTEPNLSQDNEIVEIETRTGEIVSAEPKKTLEEIQKETTDLIAAIQTKASSEAQKAGEFARESYLDAVRKARTEIENLDLFEPSRIEDAFKQVQAEVEKDWDSVVNNVLSFGDRLNEAAKAAWEVLSAPRPPHDGSQ